MSIIVSRALVLLSLVFSIAANAQVPGTSNGTPSNSFLGEQFCLDATFTNTGGPGFGPYLQLVIPADLDFNNASIFGIASITTDVGTFPASPDNQLIDPVTGILVTGPEGSTLTLIKLPLGSVVEGGPQLTTKICLTIKPTAVVGTPLDVSLVPVYEFGDTATGDNGPIVGAANIKPVTPTVILLEKKNDAPESERPPSPNWPITYTLTVNVANTATVTSIEIADQLPAGLQYVGPTTITGGVGCSLSSEPSVVTPGGFLEVTCTSATGTSAPGEITVSYPTYVTDILDETSCGTTLLTNNATLDADYISLPLPQLTETSDVTAKHMAVQKDVSPNLAAPGDNVTYSLSFQLTHHDNSDSLVLTDTMPDGVTFGSHLSLTVAGSLVTIAPTVVPNGDGTTTITYDIGAVAGVIAADSAISLSYDGSIDQQYQNLEPVLANDKLSNSVGAAYSLSQGATACNDTSGATVTIFDVTTSKIITNPQALYNPGDVVTFRLNMTVPSGDTTAVLLVDHLPLPVFKVDNIDPVFGNDVRLGPNDNQGLVPDTFTLVPATNRIGMLWPVPASTTSTLIYEVDIDVAVTDDPFADGLLLTNIFSAATANSNGLATLDLEPVQLLIGAPDLVLTKGISNSTNGNSTIDPLPSVLPVDGNLVDADANDVLTYVLTVENTGRSPAFDVLVTDVPPAGLSSCSILSVLDGTGMALANSGDLFSVTGLSIDQSLAGNDGNPDGGGPPYTADTAIITYNCSISLAVGPNDVIDNEASVIWASQPGATSFPAQTDNATVTTADVSADKLFVVTSEATTSDSDNPPRTVVGEIVRYRLIANLPEGTISTFNIRDRLPNGLNYINDGTTKVAFVSNGSGLSSGTVAGIPTITGNDPSLSAIPSSALTFSLPSSAISGEPFTSGRDPYFNFGTLVNNDNDDDEEFLVIEINVLVNNTSSTNFGNNKNNRIDVRSNNALLAESPQVRVRVAEPNISLTKVASPGTGDAGDIITYTIEVRNTDQNNGNVSSAFDSLLQDPVPTGLTDFVVSSIVVSSLTTNSCPGVSLVDSSTPILLDVSFVEVAPGCKVELIYTAKLIAGVAPGTTINNTAKLTWTSLPGPLGTTMNPTGSSTPGASGDDDGERDGSNVGSNDYLAEASAIVNVDNVSLDKTVTATSESSTGSGEGDVDLDDLTIGETATFEITATIPEGVTPQVIISDTLPYANGVMQYVSAALISVGSNLTAGTPNPMAVVSDAQLADGVDDTVSFDFGQVTNPADGVSDSNDQIKIQVVGRLIDVAQNTTGDELTNTALVQFGTGLSASANAMVDVVEPILSIVKDADVTTGDAGDTVTFSLTVNHDAASSTADAFDLTLTDTLPLGLTLVPTSLTTVSGPAPDVLTEVGNGLSATWTSFVQGSVTVLGFEATIDNAVQPTDVLTNTAYLGWTSLPLADPDERSGSTSNSHGVTITSNGMSKIITATSITDTGTGQFGPETDLTIGEHVTYQLTAVLPEGTTNSAKLIDQLPKGSSVFEVVSSQILRIGTSISGPGLPAVGTPGTASDTNMDTFNDKVVWDLGDLLNTPDGIVNDEDQIVVEVIAVVLDQSLNQSGVVSQTNTATGESATSSVSATVAADVVAPDVNLEKEVTTPADGFVDAGDTVTYELTIDHSGNSTADAYTLVITDTFASELEWVDDSTVSSDCVGLTIDSATLGEVTFTFPQLTLTANSCTISYDTLVGIGAAPGQTLDNSAGLDYDSTPVFVSGETRQKMASADAELTVLAPSLVKVTTESNVADTDSSLGDPTLFDMAIGETVTYHITIIAHEGTTSNAIVTDLMEATPGSGFLEAIGASIVSIGTNLSATLPGTPVIDDFQVVDGIDDRIIFNFGVLTNQPDGISDEKDRIVLEIVGRVVDVEDNVDGVELVNNARFDFTGGNLEDSASVEVVEPLLNLDKAMGPLTNGKVRITLTLENTGNAPAFDINISDVLDESVWDVAALSQISVSSGFELQTTAGPAMGETTLTLSSDPLAVSPAGTVPVSSTISAVFDIPLKTLPPVPNPVVNIADLDKGDTLPGDDLAARDLPPDQDTAQIGVPDLHVDKSAALEADPDNSADISPGDTLRYTLVISNTGAAEANNILLSDVPDSNTTLLAGSVTSTQGSVIVGNTAGDGAVQVQIGTLLAAGSATVTYDVIVNHPLPTGVTELINQALLESTELPPVDSNDPDTPDPLDPTIVPVNAAPDLVVSKTDGDTRTVPGGTVVYSIGYQNVGSQDATGVEITETVPANSIFNAAASTTGWVCAPDNNPGANCKLTIGDLDAGDAVQTALFAVTVDNPLDSGVEELLNTVAINDDGNNGTDPTPGNNSASDNTPIDALPDLTITKDDGGVSVAPGETVSYTLNYQNVGNQDAAGVIIGETVPANSTFNAGASTPNWICVPDTSAGSSCTLEVGALASGDDGNATFAVIVDDPLATGVTELSNTAVINDDGSNGADPTPANNTAMDNTPLSAFSDLVITKSDGGITASPGDTVAYMISYMNVGDQNATGVFINETVPANSSFNAGASSAGWMCNPDSSAGSTCTISIGSLAGAANGSVVFAVLVDSPLPTDVTQLTNITSIDDDGANGPDPTPEDNTAMDTTPLDAAPDLTISKDDGGITSAPGDTISYTLSYQNVGNQTATGVNIVETVPADAIFNAAASTAGWACVPDTSPGSSCTLMIGTLAVGASASATFAVDVDDPLSVGVVQIVNIASIQDDGNNGPDPTPENNSSTDTTPLTAVTDLIITKTDGGVTAMPGDTVVYTLDYRNAGNQNATGVVIRETVPVHSTFNAGASTGGWSCVPDSTAGSACTLMIGNLAGNANGTALFAVTIVDPLDSGITEIENTASIEDDGANGPDPTPENNTAMDDTPLDAAPDLSITKSDGDITGEPGDTVTYTLNYQNKGNQDATGVEIIETVPANTSFSAGNSSAGWACVPDAQAGSTCTLTIGNLAANANGSATFAVIIDEPLPAAVTELGNVVSINDDGSNGPDPTPDDNTATEPTPVTAVPDLTLTKDDGGVTAIPGDSIVYVLTYQNVGNQEATGTVITETVPDNSSFDAASSTAGWACFPNINAGSVCTLMLGALPGDNISAMVNFAVKVDDPLAAGVTQIHNTASIADDGNNGPDPTPENNSDSDITPLDAVPDLTISKDDGGITAEPGDTVIYTLTYQNVGNQNATGVEITETVPEYSSFSAADSSPGWICLPDAQAGSSCTLIIGNLAGSESSNVMFAVVIEDPLTEDVTQLSNTTSIGDDGSNGTDPTPEDNEATDTTPIDAGIDLVLVKDDEGAASSPGGTISYLLTYSNVGNQASTSVVITETVPDNSSFNAVVSTTGWTCTPDNSAGSICTFPLGTVAGGGESATITFAVDVDNPLAPGVTEIENTAVISDDGNNGTDPTPDDNTDSDTTPLTSTYDLMIVKDDGGITTAPGESLVYLIDYSLDGDQSLSGVTIAETVPSSTTFDPAGSSPGWVCAPDNNAGADCNFDIGDLSPGEGGQLMFALFIDAPLSAGVTEIVNTADISDDGSSGSDDDPSNNTTTDNTPVQLNPPVGKKLGELSGSGVISWTMWWFNNANQSNLPTLVFDQIPTGTVYVPGSLSCQSTGGSQCLSAIYNAARDRIEVNSIIAADFGAADDADPSLLDNEIIIQFQTRARYSGRFYNQADAFWDEDNDGSADDDQTGGQEPVKTDDPTTSTPGDPTGVGIYIAVPTLSFWALILLTLILAGTANRRLRFRRALKAS